MKSRLAVRTAIAFAILAPTAIHAALTIEQAEALSKKTGRPILAVAGSET